MEDEWKKHRKRSPRGGRILIDNAGGGGREGRIGEGLACIMLCKGGGMQ